MRIGRESWSELNPDDVAWVVEWQLAAGFRWVPLGEDSPVTAAGAPDPTGRFWPVVVHAGSHTLPARLPLRDVARVVRWCRRVRCIRQLLNPPPWVRGSLRAIRAALRAALRQVDPLGRMGYASHLPRGLGPAT